MNEDTIPTMQSDAKPVTPNVDVRLDPDLPPMNRKQRRRYVATLRKQVKAQLRASKVKAAKKSR